MISAPTLTELVSRLRLMLVFSGIIDGLLAVVINYLNWHINLANENQFDFCKLDTKFEAAKAADPPATQSRTTATCKATSQG